MNLLAADLTTKTAPKIIATSIVGCILAGLFAVWLLRRFSKDVEIGDGRHADVRRALRLLARFTEGNHRIFTIGFVLLSVEAVTTVYSWYPLTYLIDYFTGDQKALSFPGISSPQNATVALLTLVLVILTMINSAADSLGEICFARGGRTLGFRLRTSLFSHLQRLPLAFHDRSRKGDMTFRVVGDVKEFEQFVIDSLSDLAGSILLLLATIVFLFYEAWQIMLVGLVVVPGTAVISWYFSNRIKDAAKRQRAREGDLAGATHEMLNSIRVVQTFGRGGHDEKSFVENSGRAMDAALHAARLDAWFSWIVNFFEALAIAAVLWIGVGLMNSGNLSLGTLTLVTVLIRQMFKPSRKVIKEWNVIAKVFASVERIADLLDRPITVHDEIGAQPAPPLQGAIEFRNVAFSYAAAHPEEGEHDHQALSDVSFKVEPGEVVAISGPSGAGKTTIAQLIPRLYDPQQGSVLLDGHDVRTLTIDSVRAEISMVLQETLLLSGSVADNIAYGKPEASRSEVIAAAVRAHADGFIRAMPHGYDTDLTEQATNLSAGQRQRIAIARALIRDTPILILDEPTTGLDNESTVAVLAGLQELMSGRTTLLISHDLELVGSADRILMIDHGRLTESGTHGELLEQDGLYASLRQQRTIGIRGAGTANGAATGTSLDARAVPGLLRDAPDIETALDARAMASRLHQLLGASGPEWAIEECRPAKVLYTPGQGCTLRYTVTLGTPAGERRRVLVGAQLFPDRDVAEEFLAGVAPLVNSVSGRPQVQPFRHLVTELADVAMVAYAFPIDPNLPALVPATDPGLMAQRLAPFTGFASSSTDAHALQIGVERYPRRDRCLLRYENGFGVVYGKLHATPPGDLVAVHEAMAEVDGLNTPRPLGSMPELGLLLLAPVGSGTTLGRMIRGVAHETTVDELERAVTAGADLAARLHGCQATVPGVRTLDGDVARLETELACIRSLVPELASQLSGLIDAAVAFAQAERPMAPVPSHGDFTPSQILVSGDHVGLIDLDDACRGEPGLDLGRFNAYLRLASRKTARGSESGVDDQLCATFLDAYVRARGLSSADTGVLTARMQAYEAVALAHVVVQGWLQLKPARASLALELLEERVGCLDAAVR